MGLGCGGWHLEQYGVRAIPILYRYKYANYRKDNCYKISSI